MSPRPSTEDRARRRRARRRRMAAIAAAAVVLLAGLLVWQARRMVAMPGRTHAGPLPPLTDAQAALLDALRDDVTALAGRIGERNLSRFAALERSREHLEEALRAAGHSVEALGYELRWWFTLPKWGSPEQAGSLGG